MVKGRHHDDSVEEGGREGEGGRRRANKKAERGRRKCRRERERDSTRGEDLDGNSGVRV